VTVCTYLHAHIFWATKCKILGVKFTKMVIINLRLGYTFRK